MRTAARSATISASSRAWRSAAVVRTAAATESADNGRAHRIIEAGLTRRLSLNDLARVAALSPFHFARCFKATTGLAPHQYVLARRIELAKRLIMTTSQSVVEVAWSVGFENISHFRRQFVAQVGVVPGVLRRATAPSR